MIPRSQKARRDYQSTLEIPNSCMIVSVVQAALPIISGVYLLVITAWIRAVAILGSTIKVCFQSGTSVLCAWHAVAALMGSDAAPSQCIASFIQRAQWVNVMLFSCTRVVMTGLRRCHMQLVCYLFPPSHANTWRKHCVQPLLVSFGIWRLDMPTLGAFCNTRIGRADVETPTMLSEKATSL